MKSVFSSSAVVRSLCRLWQAFLVMCAWGVMTAHAAVTLPTVEKPSSGSDGNTLGWLQGLFKDGTNVIIGLVIVVTFAVTAWNAITTYGEIRSQKKTWGDLGMHGAIGFCLIIAVIYLVNRANGVL